MTPTMTEPKMEERKAEVAWTPSGRAPLPSGIAVAAFMSAMLGLLALALVNLFTDASKGFNTWVHSVGKLWMPGAEGIGPYSGKETLAVVAWLGSWIVLHLILRKKDVEISRWFIVFLVGVGVATTLIWPPVFNTLASLIAGRH
jgi:hypothetical protein